MGSERTTFYFNYPAFSDWFGLMCEDVSKTGATIIEYSCVEHTGGYSVMVKVGW